MIKRLLSILFCAMATLAVQAQKHNDKCQFSPEEFHAQLEQFITKSAGLTPKEASKFFPLYSEMLKKQRSLHDEQRNYKRIKPVSDSECKRYVEQMDKIDVEMKQIQRRYHTKFMQLLPASKVYDILQAEDKFYKQAFKRMADKRQRR